MSKSLKMGVSSLILLGFLSTPALAHSPYLKPNSFTPAAQRDHVTVEASFAEGDLRPDVAMKSDSFSVTGPDGKVTPLTPAATLRDAVFLEVPLAAPGTFLISSGVRKGRIAKAAIVNGEVQFVEPGKTPAAGAQLVDVQSLTRADVYVAHGTPTKPDVAVDGVQIHPVTAPYDAYAGEPVTVQIRENGKGLKGESLTVITDGQTYAANKVAEYDLKSNDKGEVTFTPKTAGLYLLQVRVRRPAEGTPNLWNSHTATLTLEVLPQ
ncbi:DUF4198 domain-containing protein [Asticcacaulis sp. BYS171W]|uniref:DUF4198 domain-containing protein n=1 Tax=Asticcacaulis aquaticus TaxID=2984212 RepID=A0ABT5HVZ3_9CAUL|nr:DUF4198 domain-containing protein [Asticcacaulis aquaticus]MDC7684257.1 DUF4198 domain-containing protein [Asticcacaulis aquaticus]